MEADKHILRLLELQFKYNQRIIEIDNVGIDLGMLVINENLLHLALDMLRVPADTTPEYEEWYANPTPSPPEGLFCRNSFGFEFDRVVPDGTLIQCLEFIQIVRSWVDDWNRTKGEDASS